MFIPFVSARMKDFRDLIRDRINSREVRTFMQIAIDAGQSQVFCVVRAAMFFGRDVLDMQRSQRRFRLMKLTILATLFRTFANKPSG